MRRDRSDLICAHYISKYLPLTENWIYRILVNYSNFKPVVICRKTENLDHFPVQKLYSLESLSQPRKYFEIFMFRILGYFLWFKAICSRHHVSILHVHFGYHGAKSIGLKKKLNVPMVCSFYGDDAFAHQHRDKYQSLFLEADKILVLGQYMRKALIALGCSDDKIIIHHLGIDINKIKFNQRFVSKGQKIRFLIASSFLKKKGIDLAIKALSSLADYDFTLDIIGDGPLKGELLAEIERSGMKERVTLHGYKPYDYFIAMASQCDIFIQASRTTEQNNKEGTPMAIVDAMAAGMAVVSTRHSDIPEIVIDGENGYLAEENDLDSLIACLKRILDNPAKISEFSINGRKWIEAEFDAQKQTSKLEMIYMALISKQKSHSVL